MSYSWEWLFETWGHEANDRQPISDIDIERVEADEVTTNRNSWYGEDGHDALLRVVVSYPITTDGAPATVTVWSDGDVGTAFGGTGMREDEVQEYVEQAVELYRCITGDNETTFRIPSHRSGAEEGQRIDA